MMAMVILMMMMANLCRLGSAACEEQVAGAASQREAVQVGTLVTFNCFFFYKE